MSRTFNLRGLLGSAVLLLILSAPVIAQAQQLPEPTAATEAEAPAATAPAATAPAATAPAATAPATQTATSKQTIDAPPGPKSLSFDATLPKANAAGEISFVISDKNDQPAIKVVLKPRKNPDGSTGTFQVFIGFGDAEPTDRGQEVTAGMVMSFKVIITADGVVLRCGPPNEVAEVFAKGSLPTTFNLASDALNLNFAWSYPGNTPPPSNPLYPSNVVVASFSNANTSKDATKEQSANNSNNSSDSVYTKPLSDD